MRYLISLSVVLLFSACCSTQEIMIKTVEVPIKVPPIHDTLHVVTPEPPSGILPVDMRNTVDSLNKLLQFQEDELALIPISGIYKAEKVKDGYKAIATFNIKKKEFYLDIIFPSIKYPDTISITNPNPIKEIVYKDLTWWKELMIIFGYCFIGVMVVGMIIGFFAYRKALSAP